MDELLAKLQGFNPVDFEDASDAKYDCAIKNHVAVITDASIKEEVGSLTSARSLLDTLDPAVHSASFGIVLDAVLREHKAEAHSVIDDDILRFFALFDPIQVRYIGPQFSNILDTILNLQLYSPSIAVQAASVALLRIDPDGTFLSSRRIRATSIAYQASVTDAILPLISKTAIFFPGAPFPAAKQICSRLLSPPEYMTFQLGFGAKLQPSDIMEYELTCGLIFCRHRMWSAAREAFSRAATYPLRDLLRASKIALEAYKRWVIVSLISNGGSSSMVPQPSTNGMRKSYTALTASYGDLATAFQSSLAELQEVIQANANVWVTDNTQSLITELEPFFIKWQLCKLPTIYSKVTLEEVHEYLDSIMGTNNTPDITQITDILTEMLADHLIHGNIVPAHDSIPAHIIFRSPASSKTPEILQQELETMTTNVLQLEKIARDVQSLGLIHPQLVFQMKAMEVNKNMKEAGASVEKPAVSAFQVAVDEEDLMEG